MDLLEAFRGLESEGGAITVRAERVEIDLDANRIAREVASAAAEQIQDHFEDGRAPDGSEMPPLKISTQQKMLRGARGQGPRGIDTGQMVASINEEQQPDGSYVVRVDERARGQLRRTLAGKRWAINPEQSKVRAALERAAAGMVKKG